jgi:DNA polymerase zeta
LERAIHLVNSREEWGARVVYGDTDSLFVLVKGATKEEAFQIGKEIVDAVTAENPKPVKLKFEKVSVLNTAALLQ